MTNTKSKFLILTASFLMLGCHGPVPVSSPCHLPSLPADLMQPPQLATLPLPLASPATPSFAFEGTCQREVIKLTDLQNFARKVWKEQRTVKTPTPTTIERNDAAAAASPAAAPAPAAPDHAERTEGSRRHLSARGDQADRSAKLRAEGLEGKRTVKTPTPTTIERNDACSRCFTRCRSKPRLLQITRAN